MVTLDPRAKFPPPAHNTHPELYVVGFLCIVCLARPAAPQHFKKSRARAAFEARILSEVRCMRLFSESEAKKTARDWANDEVAGEILWPAHAEILLGLEEPLRFSRALRTSRMPNIRALKKAA